MTNSILTSMLGLALLAAPAFAGQAPYENATSKAQPHTVARSRYVQPRMYSQPAVVATRPATEERRVFSYEPAQPANTQRQVYSYEPAQPMFATPSYRAAPQRHTWENATMKGLGQIR